MNTIALHTQQESKPKMSKKKAILCEIRDGIFGAGIVGVCAVGSIYFGYKTLESDIDKLTTVGALQETVDLTNYQIFAILPEARRNNADIRAPVIQAIRTFGQACGGPGVDGAKRLDEVIEDHQTIQTCEHGWDRIRISGAYL